MCRKEKKFSSNLTTSVLFQETEMLPLPYTHSYWKADGIAGSSTHIIYRLLWAKEGCIPRAHSQQP